MEVALTNRAFARIRKYQFGSSKLLSKHDDVEVRTSTEKVDIPPADKENICGDLQKAVLLGEKSDRIRQALLDYCQLVGDRV